jgi:hypothetical protein
MAVTSGVSLVYDKLSKYPRIHAFFQILAGLGFDVPKIADGFSRVLTGKTVEEAQLQTVKTAVAALGTVAMVMCLSCRSLPEAKTAGKDAVDAVEAAWLVSAQVCIGLPDASTRQKCADVLLPARTALISAALDVDNGGKDYECELVQAATALTFVSTLPGVTLPGVVKDAVALVAGLTCAPSDAGLTAPDAVITVGGEK